MESVFTKTQSLSLVMYVCVSLIKHTSHCPTSVSYTHLDVYKRQVFSNESFSVKVEKRLFTFYIKTRN